MSFQVIAVLMLRVLDKTIRLDDVFLRRRQIRMYPSVNVHDRFLGCDNHAKREDADSCCKFPHFASMKRGFCERV
jgi:hypothetical protein